jgi:hypothetical protein
VSAPEDAAALAAAGFDPAAPAPNALAKLRELRANSHISSTAIARALGNIADGGAAAMLAEMEGAAAGPLRREIRRSLFKLHQRGIEPPTEPAVSTPRPTAAADASNLSALLSPIDAEGARIVWITKPRSQGGMIRLWGITSEDEGLVGAIAGNITRRELRQEREEIERRSSMRLVEADWRVADYLLCEAYRHTPAERRGKVGNFLTLRAELIPSPPPTELQHPVYSELAMEASTDPSLELLKEPALLEWRLPGALLAAYVEELNRANQSTIVLNQMQQQDRVVQIVERAITDLLSAEGGARVRRRFEDIAYYLLKNGKREQAGWAVAAAAKIRDGAELKRLPFFVGFIRMQLGNLVAEEQQRAREEPRLIVTPAEAMRASEAARQRRR